MNNQTKKKRHILVTGCPRSGTTFLGKVLSFPTEVGYIREPFNRDFGLDDLEYEFPYIHQGMQKEQVYRDMVEALLSRKANFKSLPPSGANNLKQSVVCFLGAAVIIAISNPRPIHWCRDIY